MKKTPAKDANGFVIEKHIPLPARNIGSRKYHWNEMEVGDSVLIPNAKMESLSQSIAYSALRMGPEVKFARRKVEGGVRVWRIA